MNARLEVVIQQALGAEHDVELAHTSRRGHATRLAQAAAFRGVDVVAVLGGDGTLNEAANGLAGTDTALAALPGGSTNVFARTLGLPNDPLEAITPLLEAMGRGDIHRVGLGQVDGRYFLFHLGLGFDAAVVDQVERRGSLKRWMGHPLFIWSAITTWMRHYDRSEPRFRVRFTDNTSVDDGYFSICLNTNPYTFLGNRPLDLVPEATLDRGLAMVTMRALNLRTLVPIAATALINPARLSKRRGLDIRTDLEAVVVEAERPLPWQVDGDFLGERSRFVISHHPEAMRLVLPYSAA
ncbi:MAG: diacylglycerol kinase family lipid kinase [Actinomycetia bacterium]|nr:diacylglycerol kinase family lipid kinase [Actinomycetes bacterium]MCP4086924.1 diacylglycerol kinase family lipid kinase [Actinomycetes bacterium]